MREYTQNGVERKYPYCDYEYVGRSEWRYGYCGDGFEVVRHPIGAIPFSSEEPPVTIKTNVKRIDWEFEDGYDTVCAKTPVTPLKILGDKEQISLYPYGCAKLRMTELPLLK